ncbi:hypothetical protein J3F84DRAFT_67660 [Trichoderma pleuroticola]
MWPPTTAATTTPLDDDDDDDDGTATTTMATATTTALGLGQRDRPPMLGACGRSGYSYSASAWTWTSNMLPIAQRRLAWQRRRGRAPMSPSHAGFPRPSPRRWAPLGTMAAFHLQRPGQAETSDPRPPHCLLGICDAWTARNRRCGQPSCPIAASPCPAWLWRDSIGPRPCFSCAWHGGAAASASAVAAAAQCH